MEQTVKKFYEAPTVEVVDIKTEVGILVASTDQYESIPW
jgi:hypothetical protein